MKAKLAKKRFLSMQPDFGYLNAGASRRRLGNLRTRLGAAILLLALAFNLVGDALRDILDPTQQGRD